MIAADRCEARQRIEFGGRAEPRVDAGTDGAAPGFEREQAVKIPERDGLDWKVKKRRPSPQVGERQDAVEGTHCRRRRPSGGCHLLLERC